MEEDISNYSLTAMFRGTPCTEACERKKCLVWKLAYPAV